MERMKRMNVRRKIQQQLSSYKSCNVLITSMTCCYFIFMNFSLYKQPYDASNESPICFCTVMVDTHPNNHHMTFYSFIFQSPVIEECFILMFRADNMMNLKNRKNAYICESNITLHGLVSFKTNCL
jgi:hypothetical protein